MPDFEKYKTNLSFFAKNFYNAIFQKGRKFFQPWGGKVVIAALVTLDVDCTNFLISSRDYKIVSVIDVFERADPAKQSFIGSNASGCLVRTSLFSSTMQLFYIWLAGRGRTMPPLAGQLTTVTAEVFHELHA